ncbi:MAG TPA: M48 family metallopeptidase [Planctomycetota bacterium]
MANSPSLAGRAALAVALMIGFYLLALAIAAGLFYIPYAEWVHAGRVHPKLALGCLAAGGVILWSVVPRIDRFVAPGPRLEPDEQPELFEEIESIATATDQAPPSEVYLVGDVNAWVSQRGGMLGFGGRRVMGLGLPLLRVLSRSQLRAVLAHEFGHFHGGDVRLGPVIYRTRGAIGRTIASMTNEDGSARLLQAPFRWYGNLFLRVTHAISRRQELGADALAARTVGARPLIEGLRTIRGASEAFDSYWQRECQPVLAAGFLPPLAGGFADFLRAEGVATAVTRIVEEDLKSRRRNPFDTHPPLAERIAAVEALPPGDTGAVAEDEDDPPAITLLADAPALEARWLASVASPEAVAGLEPIEWAAVGRSVYVRHWNALAAANAALLAGLRLDALVERLADGKALSKNLVQADGSPVPAQEQESLRQQLLTAALALALVSLGAEVEALPGQPIHLHLRGERLDVWALAGQLLERKLTAQAWRTLLQRLGAEAIDLGAVAGEARTSGVAEHGARRG